MPRHKGIIIDGHMSRLSLEIYVEPGCCSFRRSLELADHIQERYPELQGHNRTVRTSRKRRRPQAAPVTLWLPCTCVCRSAAWPAWLRRTARQSRWRRRSARKRVARVRRPARQPRRIGPFQSAHPPSRLRKSLDSVRAPCGRSLFWTGISHGPCPSIHCCTMLSRSRGPPR
jgi:hypothetical protein